MSRRWIKRKTVSRTTSKWVDVFCEIWSDGSNDMEYWRVEKCSSVVVVTEDEDYFILPKNQFRPGISKCTLDFPGGRYDNISNRIEDVIKSIVVRELVIGAEKINSIQRLSEQNYAINSSFNNQRLSVYSARINLKEYRSDLIFYKKSDFSLLLDQLECLQCNFALRLWRERSQ